MIEQVFSKKKAFIAYITLGDGGLDYTLQSALALVKGGVDILEIGIPFSDPVADGPIIQKAMQRSLSKKTKVQDVITFLKAFREHSDIPVVLFSYYNPIFKMGPEFITEVQQAGAEGLLVIDLPFEKIAESSLDPILVVSTSTPTHRLEALVQKAKGFIYYACQKGTTGKRKGLPLSFKEDVARIKQYSMLPVVAGFGISNREIAAEAIQSADGFVVGSYFVEAMSQNATSAELTDLAKQIDPRGTSL